VNITRYLLTFFLIGFFSLSASEDVWSADAKKPRSPCKIRYPGDANVEWACRSLKPGETLESLFGEQWKDVLRFNRIDRRHVRQGFPLKVPKRLEEIKDFTSLPLYYPPAETEAKFILIDLSEQFLGAYEYGRLVFSAPVTTGERGNETPDGEFRITAVDRHRKSSLYFIEKTMIPYPMNYALRFYINENGVAYWIHGRDVPGYPASHGCIGLYDEPMQKKYYRYPKDPVLEDARILYEWVIAPLPDEEGFRMLEEGPRVLIVGEAP